jgi:hypothetical protein
MFSFWQTPIILAVATPIATKYDNSLVRPLSYGIAVITVLNRVSHNAHWSSDVFVVSAIGSIQKGDCGTAPGRHGKNLRLDPMVNEGALGMVLTYRF